MNDLSTTKNRKSETAIIVKERQDREYVKMLVAVYTNGSEQAWTICDISQRAH